jgi:hypothetical protein
MLHETIDARTFATTFKRFAALPAIALLVTACSGTGGTAPGADASDHFALPDADTASVADGQAGDATGSGPGSPDASSSEAGADAGSCPPCGSANASCIDVGPAIVSTLTMVQSTDGSCKIGGMILNCGGTGTAANGTPLSWGLAASSPTIAIETGGLLLDCRACPAGESTSTCNSHWATGSSTSSSTLCQNAVGNACGGEFGGDVNTLYQCSSSQTVITSVVCANGCHMSPSGIVDYCIGNDPCVSNVYPSGNISYCGADLSPNADSNTLYLCNGPSTVSATPCTNGCSSDRCK